MASMGSRLPSSAHGWLRWAMSLGAMSLGAVSLALTIAGNCGVATAGDWPAWRGPNHDGVSRESNLASSVEQVLWRVPYGGRSTPVVHDGRVYAINLAGSGVKEQECVFALELATGKSVWEHRFNVFHTDIPNSRVGWTSPVVDVETGNVYAHGVGGMFFCFSREGQVLWSRSLTETVGRISGYGGRTHTPILDEDRVIISFLNSSYGNQARGLHRYLAMDKRTGEMLWWSAPGKAPLDTTYSVPVVAVVNGQRLLIAGNADGSIYAMQARTGEKVWEFQLSQRGINSSLVVDGYRVYATHSEENIDTTEMGRVVCIDARGSGDITQTHELWRADGIAAGYASPVLYRDRLYVMNNFGVLFSFDATTGKQLWKHTVGRVGKGSPIAADGKIYVNTVNGIFAILKDAGDHAVELDRLHVEGEEGRVIELFGAPAVADGRVLFFNTEELVCLGNPDVGQQQVETAAFPEETPTDDNRITAIQVRPCEMLLRPGQQVSFRAIGFNAAGQRQSVVQPRWTYQPDPDAIDADGSFTASESTGSIGTVTAQLGELTATARVRIVPTPPIMEDFESYGNQELIDWWIGVSKAKYSTETIEGSQVLKKLADNRGPKFNRSRVYITTPLPTGYTVQADVRGTMERRQRGDVGLINARYRLELMGNVPRLRVVSWVPGPRFEATLEDFKWDPDRWYRVKFRVDLSHGKAYPRVKVWPREETEPADWLLEAEDPQPNLEGSAGIYAYSMRPVYFDNVRVYREPAN